MYVTIVELIIVQNPSPLFITYHFELVNKSVQNSSNFGSQLQLQKLQTLHFKLPFLVEDKITEAKTISY